MTCEFFCKTASTIFGKSCWMDKDQNELVEAAHLIISGLDPHKIPHLSNLGRLRSRISLVAKNEYLDAKYNDISSYHLDGIEDDKTKKG